MRLRPSARQVFVVVAVVVLDMTFAMAVRMSRSNSAVVCLMATVEEQKQSLAVLAVVGACSAIVACLPLKC